MKILAIETSCDETAISLLEIAGDQKKGDLVSSVISSALYSQIEKHREFGGVFPSLAKREHAKNLVPILDQVLPPTDFPSQKDPHFREDDKNIQWNEVEKILEREPDLFRQLKNFIENHEKPNIDMLAVTSGPGLEPALWVGINFARALSLIWNIPLMPVNHMEGHMTSVLLSQNLGNSKQQNSKDKINSKDQKLKTKDSALEFPALALLISGGHTELVLINNWGDYKKIGGTLDDAIGEAYDKVARMLDLPYPGGPEISKLAKEARDPRFREDDKMVNEIKFPRPMINSGDLNFSLSGLKTAVLYKIKKIKEDAISTPSPAGEKQIDYPVSSPAPAGEKQIDYPVSSPAPAGEKQKEFLLSEEQKKIIAREFEQSVVDVIFKKTKKAIQDNLVHTLIVGGGVIANEYIRESLEALAKEEDIRILFPTKELSTDNATMIAIAGYLKCFREKPEICPDIKAEGNLSL